MLTKMKKKLSIVVTLVLHITGTRLLIQAPYLPNSDKIKFSARHFICCCVAHWVFQLRRMSVNLD